MWNRFLARNQEAYKLHQEDPANPKPSVSFFSLGKEFTKLRNRGAFPWLKEYSFAVAREPLRRMALACKAFFQGKGHPRFKARGRDHPRFTIPDGVRIKNNHLRVPNVGWVELRRHGGGIPMQQINQSRSLWSLRQASGMLRFVTRLRHPPVPSLPWSLLWTATAAR
ncbi:MAG: hypothetical protein TH68_00370 [Candidatus Synechococcus spongiarum 142]|uniref:Uncharacterized protein n=1 Tax=Candidatus Synechococcus spongiarum 142 TaxID=1608213 RepID=A0A6N3X6Y2_9SYNE|nr:MAG: hypothetical protein TH68_00370 [Candidatus Synechococcus spongiarum 142]